MTEDKHEELRRFLNNRLFISPSACAASAKGLATASIKCKNRRIVIWSTCVPWSRLPPCQRVEEVLVVTPPELIAGKVMAWTQRAG